MSENLITMLMRDELSLKLKELAKRDEMGKDIQIISCAKEVLIIMDQNRQLKPINTCWICTYQFKDGSFFQVLY